MACVYFAAGLAGAPARFDRGRFMDRIGLPAALFDESDAERATVAARRALDEAARIDATWSLPAWPPAGHRSALRIAAVDEVRTRAADAGRSAADGCRGLRSSRRWARTAGQDRRTGPRHSAVATPGGPGRGPRVASHATGDRSAR